MAVGELKHLLDKAKQLSQMVEKLRNHTGSWCAFCGKDQSEVFRLFGGPQEGLFICNECVEHLHRELLQFDSE